MKIAELTNLCAKYIQASFHPEEDEILESLLRIFDYVFPMESIQVRQALSKFDFGNDISSNILIYGQIQSGKTVMMILTSLCYLLCGRDVIIVVRNKLDDKLQFIDRFKNIVNQLSTCPNESYCLKGYFNIVDTCDKRAVVPKNPTVFVSIYNSKNLDKTLNVLGERVSNSILYVDEADLRNCNDYRHPIFSKPLKNVYVTATAQDIIAQDFSIKCDNIVTLVPNTDIYRGVNELEINSFENIKRANYTRMFHFILADKEYERCRDDHPKIVLINVEKTLLGMDNISTDLQGLLEQRTWVGDYCIVNYVGSGIYVRSNTFGKYKHSCKSIGDLFFWMSTHGGKAVYPTIFIVASAMADRGINFSDYRSGWHLTHQILGKSKSSTCANVLQGCRILGNRCDNIPMKLYTTHKIADKIRIGFSESNRIIQNLSNNNEEFTHKACKDVEIDRDTCRKLRGINFLRKGCISDVFTVKRDEAELDDEKLERRCMEWVSDKSVIHNFIQKAMIRPQKLYTRDELSELCKPFNISVLNILGFGFSHKSGRYHGYGNVFVPDGLAYKLNSIIVNIFQNQ